MSVDPQGNLYITGYCDGGTFPVISGFPVPSPSAASYPFAIRLNPDGTVDYAVLFAGPIFAVPEGIAVDASGVALNRYAGHAPQRDKQRPLHKTSTDSAPWYVVRAFGSRA
jgi:hypothetical protein